jgi:hypothetical protein
MVNKMKLWDEIYMDRNGEHITPTLGMDEPDHKVFFFEKETSEDIDIRPKIVKVLDNKEEVIKEIQELHLKKGDKIKYEFRVHLVAE